MIKQSTALLALSEGNPVVTSGLPSQRASNEESVSISWHLHAITKPHHISRSWQIHWVSHFRFIPFQRYSIQHSKYHRMFKKTTTLYLDSRWEKYWILVGYSSTSSHHLIDIADMIIQGNHGHVKFLIPQWRNIYLWKVAPGCIESLKASRNFHDWRKSPTGPNQHTIWIWISAMHLSNQLRDHGLKEKHFKW